MAESGVLVLALLACPLLVTADVEHADHTLHPRAVHEDHFREGVHNPEFDHEAILGSWLGTLHFN